MPPNHRVKHRQHQAGIRALREAKNVIGTEAKVAEIVGVSQPSVHEMLRSGQKVPAEWCIPIHVETSRLAVVDPTKRRISCHELRPDIYPDPTFEPEVTFRERDKAPSSVGSQAA